MTSGFEKSALRVDSFYDFMTVLFADTFVFIKNTKLTKAIYFVATNYLVYDSLASLQPHSL